MSDFFDDCAAARSHDDIAHDHRVLSDDVEAIPSLWMVLSLGCVLLAIAVLELVR